MLLPVWLSLPSLGIWIVVFCNCTCKCLCGVRSLSPEDFELTRSRESTSLSFLFATPVLQRRFPGGAAALDPLATLIHDHFVVYVNDRYKTKVKRDLFSKAEESPGQRTNAFFSWYADRDDGRNRFLQEPENFELIQPVTQFIKKAVTDWFSAIGRKDISRQLDRNERDVGFTPIWPAIQHRTTVHGPHNHTFNDVSGVLFLRGSQNANPMLHLFDPRPRGIDWHAPDGASSIAAVIPTEPGDLILFPPWLTHSVEPSKVVGRSRDESDNARVTLPFNVQLFSPSAPDSDDEPRCLDCNVVVNTRWRSKTNDEL